MNDSLTKIQQFAIGLTLVSVCAFLAVAMPAKSQEATVKPVSSEKLPNVPGKSLTAITVTYAPGGKSAAHRHAGSVFAYVLSGSILVELVFGYPGIGQQLFRAIQNQDYFVIYGIVLALICALAIAMLLVDLINPLLDPRIRHGGRIA